MKRIIFLDTNVFESAKFDYESKNFINFLEICDERIIDLYITDVVKDEVLKRIHVNINDSIMNIDKNNFSILIKSLQEEDIGKRKLCNELSKKLILKFEELIWDYNIKVIPSDFNQRELLDLYFKTESPFSKQKKHEFPDAIILLTIKKYSEKNKKKVFLISNDGGMKSFCENNSIEIYEKISDMTNLLITENPEEKLLEFYHKILDEIKMKIIDKVTSLQDDFILYSHDHIDDIEVENIKIKNINLNKIDIIQIDIEDSFISLELDLKIKFSFNASYPDIDTMSRDKEDGINYFHLYNNADMEVEKTITSYLDIFLDEEANSFDIEDIQITNSEFEFFLNDENIIHLEQFDRFSSCKW